MPEPIAASEASYRHCRVSSASQGIMASNAGTEVFQSKVTMKTSPLQRK